MKKREFERQMFRDLPIIDQMKIIEALHQVGVKKGQTLLIHSFLGAFGSIPGGMEAIIQALKEAVGTSGTLIFPTYNYDFCHGVPYNHEETPSQVGQLTEFVRKRDDAIRAFHPVYSHVIMGAKQEYYTQNPGTSGFGKNSFFERLRQDPEANILLFGVDWNSATFIHHLEESLQVPYRFLKIFSGKVTKEGRTFDYSAEIFSRYLELNLVLNLKRFQKKMLEVGENTEVFLGRGMISRVKVADFFKRGQEFYQINPFYFLESPVDLSLIKKGESDA